MRKENIKRVALFCVTYNTYKELDNFYQSVCSAAEKAQGTVTVDFFVADNTENDFREIILKENDYVKPIVFPFHKNTGYIGAVQKMMGHINVDIDKYDYVAISNVDLIMQEEALIRLSEYSPDVQVGWMAPALLSQKEGRDRNPGALNRYSSWKIKALRIMFRYPFLMTIYRATAYRRHKLRFACSEGKQIYAGHGSFMLFTREYFLRCGKPEFPMFLFAEELYFAEKCRLNGLTVIYTPSIKLTDQEHASVGKMNRSDKYRHNYDSLSYIITTFYKT